MPVTPQDLITVLFLHSSEISQPQHFAYSKKNTLILNKHIPIADCQLKYLHLQM